MTNRSVRLVLSKSQLDRARLWTDSNIRHGYISPDDIMACYLFAREFEQHGIAVKLARELPY